MTRERHYVVFFSPGMLFSEQSEHSIDRWDVKDAVRQSQKVTERHGARPYGFQFVTRLEADPVSDGRGGTMEVVSKELRRSGMHYMDGRVLTLEEVKRTMPSERILISNMDGNQIDRIVTGPVKGKNYKWTHQFNKGDVLVEV